MPIHIIGANLANSPGPLRIGVEIYATNNRACLSLHEVHDGSLYECFTSNVPTDALQADEVVVCLWRLPMSTVYALLDTDCFVPIRTLTVGRARGAVWRIVSGDLLRAIEAAKAAEAA